MINLVTSDLTTPLRGLNIAHDAIHVYRSKSDMVCCNVSSHSQVIVWVLCTCIYFLEAAIIWCVIVLSQMISAVTHFNAMYCLLFE